MGHYASQYPNKKNKGKQKKQVATTAKVEEFATQFDNEFSLIACLSSSFANSVWYIDSGASCHMMGVKEYFTKLEEKKLDFYNKLGDNAKYHATGVGIVKFQREFGKPFFVEDMLYVLCMTKNLISVSTLEDMSYIVTFEEGKVYIRPKNSKVEKVIGVRYGILFRLHFEPTHALVSNNRGLGELWHRKMAHLHRGALNVLKEIVTWLPKMKVEKHEVCKGCALGKYAKTNFQAVILDLKGFWISYTQMYVDPCQQDS
ncbi:uncharacterized protein LOC131859351 [Cryptomeria japonica]|uniref:uncharacterized protein LOC131859351 n=1 Tax=Cryptomeria japonica TaxID=3369 RepID=UPI0027DA69F0|nr:uncharacterized protein LOC131859351 [Cryptomeria japonica]